MTLMTNTSNDQMDKQGKKKSKKTLHLFGLWWKGTPVNATHVKHKIIAFHKNTVVGNNKFIFEEVRKSCLWKLSFNPIASTKGMSRLFSSNSFVKMKSSLSPPISLYHFLLLSSLHKNCSRYTSVNVGVAVALWRSLFRLYGRTSGWCSWLSLWLQSLLPSPGLPCLSRPWQRGSPSSKYHLCLCRPPWAYCCNVQGTTIQLHAVQVNYDIATNLTRKKSSHHPYLA